MEQQSTRCGAPPARSPSPLVRLLRSSLIMLKRHSSGTSDNAQGSSDAVIAPAGLDRNDSEGSGARRMRILLVEDDPDAAGLLARFLEREGHEVHTAADADAAILELVTFWPDVAIVDIGLPVMDGYELADRIRDVAQCKLIALSGFGADSAPRNTAVSPFDRHLIKPVNFAALLRTLDGL